MSTKSESPHAVMEEAGVGFDPTTQHMDLSKDEKRRTTALLMAIQAYDHLIIKDAEMYLAIKREEGRDPDGPVIRPATMDAMVQAAIQFDDFISGKVGKHSQIVCQRIKPFGEKHFEFDYGR